MGCSSRNKVEADNPEEIFLRNYAMNLKIEPSPNQH